ARGRVEKQERRVGFHSPLKDKSKGQQRRRPITATGPVALRRRWYLTTSDSRRKSKIEKIEDSVLAGHTECPAARGEGGGAVEADGGRGGRRGQGGGPGGTARPHGGGGGRRRVHRGRAGDRPPRGGG